MEKIVFVGQTSGRAQGDPLAGAAGRRLAALASLDLDDFLERFERRNLLDEQPGKFDVKAARDVADRLRHELSGRRAVLLGRDVAAAFCLEPDDYAWFRPLQVPPDVEVTVMPHPRGISCWWNNKSNLEAARDFMQRMRVDCLDSKPIKKARPGARKARPGARKFSKEQVKAALEAAYGVYTFAARVLAEELGTSCTPQTIINYCEHYPELAEIAQRRKREIVDIAEHNVIAAIRSGDLDSSWKLLRSRAAAGRGYELQINTRVDGKVEHHHVHEVTLREIEAMSPADRMQAYRGAARGDVRLIEHKKAG